ncbi:MAG: DUF3179 domain-containing protein, partial [Chloroflexi bacterium]|nr:DUF3179 domain-containing protein [Chloroflexota bacterium]
MAQLLESREPPVLAIDRIVGARDQRFVAVFLELIRAGELGLLPGENGDEGVRAERVGRFAGAAELLTGQALGSDWPAWVEWYGATDLAPPPGFLAWKGEVFARIDPRFRDLFQAQHESLIRVEEILWGGVRVDGIPALMNPPTLAAADSVLLTDFDPVFGLEVGGEARAYPLRIMDWHEMANDVLGGAPISLSYCTLCGAAIAYHGRASDGKIYTFGSSGLLYASNKLMYDHQTRTLWNQFTGEPVQGPLVNS